MIRNFVHAPASTLLDLAKKLPQQQFVSITAELSQFMESEADTKLLVITLCSRGRRRSVGSRCHCLTYLRRIANKLGINVVDGPRINFKRNMCKQDCLQCERLDDSLKEEFDQAAKIFSDQMEQI